MMAQAMIYLEDPQGAIHYDSLPSAPYDLFNDLYWNSLAGNAEVPNGSGGDREDEGEGDKGDGDDSGNVHGGNENINNGGDNNVGDANEIDFVDLILFLSDEKSPFKLGTPKHYLTVTGDENATASSAAADVANYDDDDGNNVSGNGANYTDGIIVNNDDNDEIGGNHGSGGNNTLNEAISNGQDWEEYPRNDTAFPSLAPSTNLTSFENDAATFNETVAANETSSSISKTEVETDASTATKSFTPTMAPTLTPAPTPPNSSFSFTQSPSFTPLPSNIFAESSTVPTLLSTESHNSLFDMNVNISDSIIDDNSTSLPELNNQSSSKSQVPSAAPTHNVTEGSEALTNETSFNELENHTNSLDNFNSTSQGTNSTSSTTADGSVSNFDNHTIDGDGINLIREDNTTSFTENETTSRSENATTSSNNTNINTNSTQNEAISTESPPQNLTPYQSYINLFHYFDDLSLVQDPQHKYIYYDSKQAQFGMDLGPRGNAEFVNLMLPPTWWGEMGFEEFRVNVDSGSKRSDDGSGKGNDNDPQENKVDEEDKGADRSPSPKSTLNKANEQEVVETDLAAATSVSPTAMPTTSSSAPTIISTTSNGGDAKLRRLGDDTVGIFHEDTTSSSTPSPLTLTPDTKTIFDSGGDNNNTIDYENVDRNATTNSNLSGKILSNHTGDVDNGVNSTDHSSKIVQVSDYFCLEDFIQWKKQQNKCSQNSSHRRDQALFNNTGNENGEYFNVTGEYTIAFNPCFSKSGNDPPLPVSSTSSNPDAVASTRPISIMAQRGRCSFESKAHLAMVLNEAFAAYGKSNRIEHIIVYNNGTDTDNITNNEEKLIDMSSVAQMLEQKENGGTTWNDADRLTDNIQVGLVYVTTSSGLALLQKMKEREIETELDPHLDVSTVFTRANSRRDLQKTDESTKSDPESGMVDEGKTSVYDPKIVHGWFFPVTITRFCLSCGPDGYGFETNQKDYPGLGHSHGDVSRPSNNGGPPRPPVDGKDLPDGYMIGTEYYPPKAWVEAVRRLMIAILVILLAGPVVLAVKRWFSVGGTVRIARDENGRRHLRIISPNVEVFINGVPGTVETNGTKLDRAQVFALPEIEYDGPGEYDVDEDATGHLSSTVPTESETSSTDVIINVPGPPSEADEPLALAQSPSGPQSTPSRASSDGGRFVSSTCCSICLEEFTPGELVRMLPRCEHIYHTECLLPWLTERQGCCPMCKTPVLPEELQRNRRESRRHRRVSTRLRRLRRRSHRGSRSTPSRRRSSEPNTSQEIVSGVRLLSELENDLAGPDDAVSVSESMIPLGDSSVGRSYRPPRSYDVGALEEGQQ